MGQSGTYRKAKQVFAPGTFKQPVQQDPNDEKLIESQFADLRRGQQANLDEAKRQQKLELDRASNAGGGFGGAELKLRQNAAEGLERAGTGAMAELGAQEAGMKLQSRMFTKELEENKKTNMINALTALNTAGFLKGDLETTQRLAAFFDRFKDTYGNRSLPQPLMRREV